MSSITTPKRSRDSIAKCEVRSPTTAGHLNLLRAVKEGNPRIKTKTGLMLGLGESRGELLDVLADLLDQRCDFLTLGQYLQPDQVRFLPVVRYLEPAEFDELGDLARRMGFAQVASGPFVRSSYHARDMAMALDAGAEWNRTPTRDRPANV